MYKRKDWIGVDGFAVIENTEMKVFCGNATRSTGPTDDITDTNVNALGNIDMGQMPVNEFEGAALEPNMLAKFPVIGNFGNYTTLDRQNIVVPGPEINAAVECGDLFYGMVPIPIKARHVNFLQRKHSQIIFDLFFRNHPGNTVPFEGIPQNSLGVEKRCIRGTVPWTYGIELRRCIQKKEQRNQEHCDFR